MDDRDPHGSFLLRGGSVCTMDPRQPWAQAVVVRGDRIAYVGTEAGALAHVDAGTEVVDVRGGMVLPGFVDAHNHLAGMAVVKLGVDLSGIVGTQAVLDAVRAWVMAQPEGAVLRGHGWIPDSFDDGRPRREWLDEITGDRPMLVMSADAHDGWFNTAAMRLAGLSAASPDPFPGRQYYHRDPDGTPTGYAVEGAATIPLMAALGLFSPEAVREAQRFTLDRAPSWGMTTYMEAGVAAGPRSRDAAFVYAGLVERDLAGELPIRVVGSVWTRDATDVPAEMAAELADWHARFRSPHVQVSIQKMFADGGLLSGTGLLLDPCCGGPHTGGKGGMAFDPAHIEAQVEATQRAGFDMHVHTDGDGSVRTVLDAIERVQSRLGRTSRHTIAHNTVVHPDDVRRFAELGVIANCTPLWGTDYNGQYVDMYDEILGSERVQERLFPYGDLVRSGAVVTYGSDIPGVTIEEIPPLIQIEALLTRQRPGYPDDRPLVPRQRIGLADALRGYTIDSAYALRLENEIGSIEAGKRADLVVLAEDLTRVPVREVHAVPVVLTLMDGIVTHRA